MANPVFTVDVSQYDSLGYVRITWDNTNIGTSWYSWRLYRRIAGGDWKLLSEYTNNVATYTYDDYTPPANTSVDYSVVRVYLESGNRVEEPHTPQTVAPTGSFYWLIHPTDSRLNFQLRFVTADSGTDEADLETMKIIGHGRRFDQGTYWGVSGSIQAQLRDDLASSARTKLSHLRSLKSTQADYLWLRNPFGDVWQVAIGDIAWTRVSGVGLREFVDVSFDYQELNASAERRIQYVWISNSLLATVDV